MLSLAEAGTSLITVITVIDGPQMDKKLTSSSYSGLDIILSKEKWSVM